MYNDFIRKRYFSLTAAVIINVFIGFLYAWSVVANPLAAKYGWSATSVSVAYTINSISGPTFTLLAAKLKEKFKIKTLVRTGAVLVAAGLIGCGLIRSSVFELYLFFGVLYGTGTALIYPSLIAYSAKAFPDKSGFGGGIITASYSSGALLWSPMANFLNNATGSVSKTFIIAGASASVIALLLSNFLLDTPENFAESFKNTDGKSHGLRESVYDVDRKGMLKTPLFYMIFIAILPGLICGTMIITQGSPILVNTYGIDPQFAATVVGLLSLTGAIGKILWGIVSDKINTFNTLLLLSGLTAAAMALLAFVQSAPVLIGLMLFETFLHGGFCSLISPMAANAFGQKNVALNYSVLFCVFIPSSIVAPPLIAFTYELSGSFTSAFAAGSAMAVISLILSVFIVLTARKIMREKRVSN